MNADGGGKDQITNDPVEPIYPAWSPSGDQISYADFLSGSFIIDANVLWSAQTPESLPLLSSPDEVFVARAWSPDGRYLAGDRWLLTDNRADGILVYSFESREYELVSESGAEPTWLSDSRTIVFQSSALPPSQLMSVDRLIKEVVPILSSSPNSLAGPKLTADDRTLFFTGIESESDIFIITLPEG